MDGGSVLLSTRGILQLLRKHGHTATFFVVGEVNDWYPTLIQEIREQGHEVAYHSHTHQPFTNVDSLRKEIERSKDFIECFRPRGFRAPRASITRECLVELGRRGFLYDSSSYGPFNMCRKVESIIEIPISTYNLRRSSTLALPRPLGLSLLRNLEIPFGSGYFVSLFSQVNPAIVSYFIERSNERKLPSVLCLHPWQMSRCEYPLSRSGLSRLGMLPYDVSSYKALEHLVERHEFCSVSELLEDKGLL